MEVKLLAYFDESGSHSGSPILCVGGYVFEPQAYEAFEESWQSLLSDFRLPFSHLVACEASEYPFDRTPSELRSAFLSRAINTISDHMTYAVVVSVKEQLFDAIVPSHPLIGNAYSWLANQMFAAVTRWARSQNHTEFFDYHFESGHKHQAEATRLMDYTNKDDNLKAERMYANHSFVSKESSPGLQAADLLVWHYSDDWCRTEVGKPSRDRYVKLIDDRYWHMYWNEAELKGIAETIRALASQYPDAGKSID